MSEAYGAFAYAFDQSLGREFFARIVPLIDEKLSAYGVRAGTHLDLACGTGLAMEHFSRRGFTSVGLDASLPMLSVARSRSRDLVNGDLRDLPFRATFGCITCLYDSLNHLLRFSDLVRAFRSVRTLMNGDSLFLFDMNQPRAYQSVWATPEPFEARGANYSLSIRTRYSRWTGMAIGWVTGWAERAGRRIQIDEVRRQRSYSRRSVVGALARARLEPVEIVDFDPFPASKGTLETAKWLLSVRAI